MESMTHCACILLFIWTTLIEGVLSAEFCYNGYHVTTYYCEYGCCGDGLDKYCCTFSLAALIAGCVVGAVFLIAFLVFVGCYYMKRKGQAGRVVAPGTNTVAVVNTTVQQNNVTQGGATNQVSNQIKVTSGQYPGQAYPGPIYGQAYPSSGQGPAYPPPYGQTYPLPGTTQQTSNQPLYPPVSQASGQAQYPPGPPPEASMYQ